VFRQQIKKYEIFARKDEKSKERVTWQLAKNDQFGMFHYLHIHGTHNQ
jgi:hypothetical protein